MPLLGLGIPSDVEVAFDGATVGKVYKSPRDPMVLVGLVITSPVNGGTLAIFCDCPSYGARVGAPGLAKLAREALMRVGPREAVAARRVSLIATDGAHAKGGPASKRGSSPAAAEYFRILGRGEAAREVWDDFRRADIAGARACRSEPLYQAFSEVTRGTYKLYGFGQGRALKRAVSKFLGQKDLAVTFAQGAQVENTMPATDLQVT
jgi:hypothetical protein